MSRIFKEQPDAGSDHRFLIVFRISEKFRRRCCIFFGVQWLYQRASFLCALSVDIADVAFLYAGGVEHKNMGKICGGMSTPDLAGESVFHQLRHEPYVIYMRM